MPCNTMESIKIRFLFFLGQKQAQQHEQYENVVFLVSSHDGNEEIGGFAQNIDFRPKNSIFGPKKGHFGQSVPKNGPPNGHLPENQSYPELPQDMGDL